MTKHRYKASGISCYGDEFNGECIANDIIEAIIMFKEHEAKFSVHSIERLEQASSLTTEGIIYINFYN